MEARRIGGGLLVAVGIIVPPVIEMANLTISQDVAAYILAGCVLVVVVGLLLAFWPPHNKPASPSDAHYVTSHNQSGGVTAHTVNVGRSEFEITPVIKGQISALLSEAEEVRLELIGDERVNRARTAVEQLVSVAGKQITVINRIGLHVGGVAKPFAVLTSGKVLTLYFNTQYW